MSAATKGVRDGGCVGSCARAERSSAAVGDGVGVGVAEGAGVGVLLAVGVSVTTWAASVGSSATPGTGVRSSSERTERVTSVSAMTQASAPRPRNSAIT